AVTVRSPVGPVMVTLAFAMAAPALSVMRPLIPPLVAMSCARTSAEEQSRMAKEASRETAPALNGLTRFMINPPGIEKSLGAGRAARLCLLFESPRQTAPPLNRFVNESRKKRKSVKRGSKTWIDKNQIALI